MLSDYTPEQIQLGRIAYERFREVFFGQQKSTPWEEIPPARQARQVAWIEVAIAVANMAAFVSTPITPLDRTP